MNLARMRLRISNLIKIRGERRFPGIWYVFSVVSFRADLKWEALDPEISPRVDTVWLVSFSDTIKGPMPQLFFGVVLPNGTVVEPKVEKRL